MRSIYQRCLLKVNRLLKMNRQGHLRNFELYLPYITDKWGLEIGGPSDVFRKGNPTPVYEEARRVDNCDFSKANVWAKHSESFVFNSEKAAGTSLFCEGSALEEVPDSTYDFVLSSHNLEHFANPIKAVKEWQRVLRPGGALILTLPYYRYTFDHLRQPTSVDHMFDDFEQNTNEDDLTHLPEILEKHDLTMDIAAGSKHEFHGRSLDNFSNRCLHHHVFDEHNSRELLSRAGFRVLSVETVAPPHICILAQLT
ncbi:class I SAM-dependent methyltransferase [Granulicella sp. S190]|uniref:class I SAM-dependent methyltransferase n=1 Tax=Granulicella sp. S190 TaxID=1747226 RepID=UPI00131AD1C6|nr:class I SAM-dependent methyltransferase [Granulicella sp. S190]